MSTVDDRIMEGPSRGGAGATVLPGLETLGWPLEGAVAAVSRALLDGEPVTLRAAAQWPLPALPSNVRAAEGTSCGGPGLWITDTVLPLGPEEAVLRPPSLVVGVGAGRGVSGEEVLELIGQTLDDAGLSPRSLTALATVDAKAGEPGLIAAAGRLGVPLRTYAADALSGVDVPNPSDASRTAVGTPSVAEAAALLAAGTGQLLAPKAKSAPADGSPAMATAAVARLRPRGRLALIGLSPGARDLLTPRTRDELQRAAVLVGLDQNVDRVRDLLRPGTRILASGLGADEERARTAFEEARTGHAVALIAGSYADVHAMTSPASAAAGPAIDVVRVPGVTPAPPASVVTFSRLRSRGGGCRLPETPGTPAEHRDDHAPGRHDHGCDHHGHGPTHGQSHAHAL